MSVKIHDDIFSKCLNYDSMYKAYINTKRGKVYKPEVVIFNMKLEYNIKKIVADLEDSSYCFGEYKKFYIYEPKKRCVLSAPFRDRIVHTWYVQNFLEPYFVPSFIPTTYACLKGRGMHKCALDMQKMIYTCSYLKEYSNAYILKMDISKYFNNINRQVLYTYISKKIYDKKFLELTKKILNTSSKFDDMPGIGLPIGNYTSQMFANIYLDKLDKYIIHTLKCKYVSRYMDDVICIFKNKLEAKDALKRIDIFLDNNLGLKLNPKTNIFKLSQGVNYCGYKINKYGLRLRNCGKRKLKNKIKSINIMLKSGKISIKEAKKMLAGNMGYAHIANLSNIFNYKL